MTFEDAVIHIAKKYTEVLGYEMREINEETFQSLVDLAVMYAFAFEDTSAEAEVIRAELQLQYTDLVNQATGDRGFN